MNPRLIAISGPLEGSVIPIKAEETTFGRAADNHVVLDDPLASRYHFASWAENGELCFRHLKTKFGVLVDGELQVQGTYHEGSRTTVGSSTFVCVIQEVVPPELLRFSEDEIERNRELETLLPDTTSLDNLPAHRRHELLALYNVIPTLTTIQNKIESQEQLIDLAFKLTPALRGAVLINGEHSGPDLSDFVLKVYRKSDSDSDDAFPVSSTVLAEVYRNREAWTRTAIAPALCAPMFLPGGRVKGVLYLEGTRNGAGFEPEHIQAAKAVAALCLVAFSQSREVESIRRERDVLKTERVVVPILVGESAAIQAVRQIIEVAAKSNAPVLITGESGTGKENVARMIHWLSQRKDKVLVTVNCAAVPDTLFESTYFGHLKGSFTGATEAAEGKFKLADGGTLLLDEVGEIPIGMQAKLLRVLQNGEVEPVGGRQTTKVDVRIIASTNVDLQQAISKGTFRPDLYYRLSTVLRIVVPPLRERMDDIPLLVRHFLDTYGADRGVDEISDEALKIIMSYHWPGNVRELQGIVTAGVEFAAHTGSLEIQPRHLPAGFPQRKAAAASAAAPGQAPKQSRGARKEAVEDEVVRVWEQTKNVSKVAEILGLSEGYVYRVLRRRRGAEA